MSAEKIVRMRFFKFHSGMGKCASTEIKRFLIYLATDSYHPCIMIFLPKHSGVMYYLWIYDGQAPLFAFHCVSVHLFSECRNGESLRNVRMADLEEGERNAAVITRT